MQLYFKASKSFCVLPEMKTVLPIHSVINVYYFYMRMIYKPSNIISQALRSSVTATANSSSFLRNNAISSNTISYLVVYF